MTKQELKDAHRAEMKLRRRRQHLRLGFPRSNYQPLRNDPHYPHSHIRENARRVRQMGDVE